MPPNKETPEEIMKEMQQFLVTSEEEIKALEGVGASEEIMDQAAHDIQQALRERVREWNDALQQKGSESPWQGKPEWPG